MNRIDSKFLELKNAKKKAFIPYITAGDPDLDTTRRLVLELEKSGADIIEVGVPFSDPIADGPVIQRASERALKNGTSISDCLLLVNNIREVSDVPIVLFTYFNPLLSLCAAGLGNRLAAAGVDGVLVTDLVPEEADQYLDEMRSAEVDTIFLTAPTSTDERLKRIADSCRGFVYAVSRTGVTGIRQSLTEAAADLVGRLRKFTDLPVALGFGISTREHVDEVWRFADAAVIGSRLVAEIESSSGPDDVVSRAAALTRDLVSGRT